MKRSAFRFGDGLPGVAPAHVGDDLSVLRREPTTRLHRADAWHIRAQTAQGIDDGCMTTWRRWRRKIPTVRAVLAAESGDPGF